MAHVDLRLLSAPDVASRPARRRALLHLDRCVACRRLATAEGIGSVQIAALLSAERPRRGALVALGALAALIGLATAVAPVRGAALGLVGVFEPQTVRAVPLTVDEMRSLGQLPDLADYATTRELRASSFATYTDPRAAMAAAGFALRAPTYVPGGARAVAYLVHGPNSQLLTFVRRDPLHSASAAPVPLPADIIGSSLRLDLGATVTAAYGTAATAADQQRLARPMRRMSSSPPAHPATPQARQPRAYGLLFGGTSGALPLVVVQMPVPRVASTGVSVARLASFMLSQPGIPPRVAAAFGALGDFSTTLPLPVPIDTAYTQPVVVDGVLGVGIGDDTGIGAAVVWQKRGILYGVFASRPARDVLAIANSLR